jgi:hypothetical protein
MGYGSASVLTTGANNVALGHDALVAHTTASNNTAVGAEAGAAITTGGQNTACGYGALKANTTATYNDAFGYNALDANTTGASNVAFGSNALGVNTTGGSNVAVGTNAFNSHTTASYNTAMGSGAGFTTTTGGDNVYLGFYAGYLGTTAAQNVFIGRNAGYNLTTGTYNVYIGYNNQPSAVGVSHEGVIANGNITGKGTATCFIFFNSGGTYQGNNSADWSTTSDRRIKKNIVDSPKGLDEILKVTPKNFEYKSDEELQEEFPGAKENLPLNVLTTSAIAQEVQEVFPESVVTRDNGMMTVDRGPVVWAMVNAIKELSAEIDELKKWKEEHTCG